MAIRHRHKLRGKPLALVGVQVATIFVMAVILSVCVAVMPVLLAAAHTQLWRAVVSIGHGYLMSQPMILRVNEMGVDVVATVFG